MVIPVGFCRLWQKTLIQLEHDEIVLLLKIPNIKNFLDWYMQINQLEIILTESCK